METTRQFTMFDDDMDRDGVLERAVSDHVAQTLMETAHDLRAPLAAAAANAEMLMNMTGPRLSQHEQARMAMLLNSIDRMAALVQQALSHADAEGAGETAESGGGADGFTVVDLDAVVADVLTSMGDEVDRAGADVRAARLGLVRGDALQLSRVFQNLIGNALRYRNPTRRLVLRVRVRNCQDERIFTVADNGMGMSRSACMHVFDPHASCVPDREGHGMGLRICRRIVEDHGGRIWVKPTRGGTAVSFALSSLPS